jgi:hypothetical protein
MAHRPTRSSAGRDGAADREKHESGGEIRQQLLRCRTLAPSVSVAVGVVLRRKPGLLTC